MHRQFQFKNCQTNIGWFRFTARALLLIVVPEHHAKNSVVFRCRNQRTQAPLSAWAQGRDLVLRPAHRARILACILEKKMCSHLVPFKKTTQFLRAITNLTLFGSPLDKFLTNFTLINFSMNIFFWQTKLRKICFFHKSNCYVILCLIFEVSLIWIEKMT